MNANRRTAEQANTGPATALPDEAAREHVRTRLDQTFVVEAGAGTGKTSLLVDRVENLIASGRARLRNIIAITFTEKAAAELRVAIRQRIGRRLHETDPEIGQRFHAALADLEIAPVSTIHAFAADLLRERPVEAGVDPAFAVADELQASLFRTEAWDRWLEKQKDAAPEGLREAVEFGLSLTQLRDVGDDLIRFRDVLTQDLDRGPQPQDPLAWLRGAEPVMRAAIKRIDADCRDKADVGASDLLELGQTLDLLGRLAESEARRAVLGGMLRLKIRGRVGSWKAGALQQIRERLGGLLAELESLKQAHGHWLAAGAVNWLRGYVAEYQALKAREGILDFDDLLLLARNMLRGNRDVRRDFQERFEAVLVDEFQDTDPLQAEIIFFLAEDGPAADTWTTAQLVPGKLFIVGDPKQSIYAFRRADIETYELAKEVLQKSGALEYITANFRSVQPILDAVNATFRNRMTRPDDGMYQPEYVELEPSHRTRGSDDSPALIMLYPDPEANPASDVATLRGIEAEGVAAFIRHMVNSGLWKIGPERRPATFGDVALLFRGMADVPTYEEELKRYDIPYRVTSSRTFYKREEIGWLLNVLHAIEHPTDAVAVWGALRSPLFGCADTEVYAFIAGGGTFDYRTHDANGRTGKQTSTMPESIAAAYGILRAMHLQRNLLSVPQMVEEVLVRTSALQIFLLTPQGEQRVANLVKVVQLARALEGSGILTFRAFVHWLRDMERQAVDEAESPTVEEGDDVVRIMSIHAAKGLEFPIVVLPDLGHGAGSRADHLILQRVRGEAGFYFGKVGQGGWPVQTANYQTLKDDNGRREAAERLRVLYVGMTRAKDALVLPCFPKKPANTLMVDLAHVFPQTPDFEQPHGEWILVDGAGIGKVEREPAPVRLQFPDEPMNVDVMPSERAVWLEQRQKVVETAGLPDKVTRPSKLLDPAKLAAVKQMGTRLEVAAGGQNLGTLVHQILAVIPLDRPDLAAVYAEYFARQKRVRGALVERAVALVQAALGTAVVKTALAGRPWREVPFAMLEGDGTLVEGTMDLLVEAPDGKLIVADWKTDTTAPEKREAVMSLYAPQLDAYDAVLKRLGYDSEQRLVLLGAA
ncbi:MAG TPA: UvrD-helicase domain-containing protein [bacterium]